ncbi:hypothetical protein ACUH91_04725 [Dermabacteraceae bacterium P9123]
MHYGVKAFNASVVDCVDKVVFVGCDAKMGEELVGYGTIDNASGGIGLMEKVDRRAEVWAGGRLVMSELMVGSI